MNLKTQAPNIKIILDTVEPILVSIDDIAKSYGKWQPDLRVDPRLRKRLVKLVELCRADPGFGDKFILPVSSCYRPFLQATLDYIIRDATDPRGHWAGLAIDIGYQIKLSRDLWDKFVEYARKAGLIRIHLKRHGEHWHFSGYGIAYQSWRPARAVAKLRWKVCKALGIL